MNPKHYLVMSCLMFSGHFNPLAGQTFDSLWAVQLQNTLNTIVSATGLTGVSGAVYVPGQGTWTGAAGISQPGVPVTTDMRFGIGSNTKLFTAVTLLKLQEQGVLSLDDSLGFWLPDFPNVNSAVSIRQLLTHQSGIFDFLNDNPAIWTDSIWADPDRFWTAEEVLATIGASEFQAGRGFQYSNTGYMLAGMVMEAATGKSWALNVREQILAPHGLYETFSGAFEVPNGPVAIEWFNSLTPMLNTPMTSEFSLVHAAGAILSTGADMTHWYSELFNGNVLTAASMREMVDFEPTTLYGLGIATHYFNLPPEAPFKVLQHSGRLVGFNSLAFFDPKTGISAFFVSNSPISDNLPFDAFILGIYNNIPEKTLDAGIVDVTSPWATICGESVAPSVTLRNFGTDTLTSVVIHFGLEGGVLSVFNWTGMLPPSESIPVDLPAVTLTGGPHDLVCFTLLPNGAVEGYHYNDTARSHFLVKELAASVFPVLENFDSLAVFPPEGWSVSSNSLFEWGRTRLASWSGLHAVVRNNYLDADGGAIHDLVLPALDCSSLASATLTFNYAYTNYPGYNDSLRIQISEDCGDTWQTLFYSGGSALRTATPSTVLFYPNPTQWKPKSLPMNSTGSEVLLRFRSINSYGNNLYLDDIRVYDDVSVAAIEPEKVESFDLFPSPATSSLFVEGLPNAVDFTIMDVSGQIVLRGVTGSSQTGISVGHLPPGFYVFQTAAGSKKWVKM